MSGLRIGIDVGGTNTDAALLSGSKVLTTVKVPTSADVTTGAAAAIGAVIARGGVAAGDVGSVMIGTTHFLNAVIEGRHLQKVGILRLCGQATRALMPLTAWPENLRKAVDGGAALVDGGVNVDTRPIAPLDHAAIREACGDWRKRGVTSFAVTGVFSLADPAMELAAAEIIADEVPGATVSLSHRIGANGFLRRENATILNAALASLGQHTIAAFQAATAAAGLHCPLWLTQNDGTLMAAATASRLPILTLASGPTNSLRGAAFLTGLRDAVVIDIGGTTTDIGVLVAGFPRSRSEGAEIAGIATNFRLPDVLSFGLGGGSHVDLSPLEIGPLSVGFRLTERARVFGGPDLTATDIAVAGGLTPLGNPALVTDLPKPAVKAALALMRRRVEEALDRMKPSADPVPVVLVGGGAILIEGALEGADHVLRPEHSGSANAVGAAIAQVSGEDDRVVVLDGTTRDAALASAVATARERAIEAGADPARLEVVELEDRPLAYLPGNTTRIRAKVVGDIA
jgi:N-methylhydantoinase A/oxoprolinase/acetone carboxylase beta subunit